MTEDHEDRLKDPDEEVRWLGELEGMTVRGSDGGPVLFLHGSERSCSVEVLDGKFADGLARAGVEIEALLEANDG